MTISGKAKLAGVMGWPVGHSRSPRLHGHWLERYGIDAAVHELNVNWIAGLNDHPSAAHWKRYGEQLTRVFDEYFEAVKP